MRNVAVNGRGFPLHSSRVAFADMVHEFGGRSDNFNRAKRDR